MTRLADLAQAPWAITTPMFQEVQGIYARHVRGEKIDLNGLEARIGRPLDNQQPGISVRDGVAVVEVNGVLGKRMNLLTQISGGSSTQIIGQQLDAAMADPGIRAIVLNVDSPGGTVDGTQELADKVFQARGAKPIVAVADGMMASAAYWIGSAADQVFITSDTTAVGSIGVVATHQDVSKAEEARGVKTTEVTAGKYKRAASAFGPLTEEGRQVIQDQVDHTYSVFVDAVARHRGVSADRVLTDMAEGRIFLGQQAIRAGLVDGVSTLDQVVAKLAGGQPVGQAARKRAAVADGAGVALEASDETNQEHEMTLTIEKVRADHPDVAAALEAEGFAKGKAEAEAAAGAAATAAADAERERIKSVLAQSMPGHEKLVQALAFDGKTTGPEAAMQVLSAERAKLGGRAAALEADAAAAAGVPAAPPAASGDDLSGLSVEDRCQRQWEQDAKVRGEFPNLAAYTAFTRASEKGLARVKTTR